ncbi:KDELC2 [Symbiodinium necroappetens]|uniref:KDELC2 protein n=1 Tax=Symbiodinium necroappetens TaxID=1628268 RepID=A0A812T1V6_9DINO|nr:KDELC2 [Symbiodinium necroappetens]
MGATVARQADWLLFGPVTRVLVVNPASEFFVELQGSPSQRLVRLLQSECAPRLSPACLRQQGRHSFENVVSLEKAVVTGINGGHVHVASTDCPPWRPLFQTYYLAVDALVLMLDISSGRTPSEPAKFERAIAQDVEGVRNFLCKFDDWEACPLLILCHATDTESVAFDAERIRGEIGKCELRQLPNRVRHFSWSSPSLLPELREDLAWLVTAKESMKRS